MAGGDDDLMTTGSRPGWRDVYDAVQKSQDTIIAHIDDVVKPLSDAKDDHEARLRFIEQGITPWQVAVTESLKDHGKRIGDAEGAIKSDDDKSGGFMGALRAGERIIILTLLIGSFVLSVVALVVR